MITRPYTLDIIGGGCLEDEVRKKIEGNKRITFLGKLMPNQVREILTRTDVLLQTSKLEGWGCTINEALMFGNRVIVSDAVGAKALLYDRPYLGTIFKSNDWNSFKTCVESELDKGGRTTEERKQICNWARCIYPEAEANYFSEIIDYYLGKETVKAEAPWNWRNDIK